MVRHTQTIRRKQPTNYSSVFDHFVRLALKRGNFSNQISTAEEIGEKTERPK